MAERSLSACVDFFRPDVERLGADCRSRPGVESVATEFDVTPHAGGASGYIDIELKNGVALTWWLDIVAARNGWSVEPSILVNRGQGQHPIRELAPWTAEDGIALSRAIQAALLQALYLPFYISKISQTEFTVSDSPALAGLGGSAAANVKHEILPAGCTTAVTMQSAESMIYSSYYLPSSNPDSCLLPRSFEYC